MSLKFKYFTTNMMLMSTMKLDLLGFSTGLLLRVHQFNFITIEDPRTSVKLCFVVTFYVVHDLNLVIILV